VTDDLIQQALATVRERLEAIRIGVDQSDGSIVSEVAPSARPALAALALIEERLEEWEKAAEKATELAERYGEAIVALSACELPTKARLIIAALAREEEE
jgi:hypothetical protein